MVTLFVIGVLLLLFGLFSKEPLQKFPVLFGGIYLVVFAFVLIVTISSLILTLYSVGGLVLMMLLNLLLARRADPSDLAGERKQIKVLSLAGLLVIVGGIIARLTGYTAVRGIEGAGVLLILLAAWQKWILHNIEKRKASI